MTVLATVIKSSMVLSFDRSITVGEEVLFISIIFFEKADIPSSKALSSSIPESLAAEDIALMVNKV